MQHQIEPDTTPRWSLTVAIASDVGQTRRRNEDFPLVARLADDRPVPADGTHEDGTPLLLAVADGLGGLDFGSMASVTVTSALAESLRQQPPAEDWRRRIIRGFDEAQAELQRVASSQDIPLEMGSTLVAAVVEDSRLIWASSGDSRLYHATAGQLRRISEDQTVAQHMANLGQIAEEEISGHHQSHRLLRYIGVREAHNAQSGVVALADGDWILLCSDGLYRMLSDSRIAETLDGGPESIAAKCQHLVEEANKAGGRDNITVVLARYRIVLAESPPSMATPPDGLLSKLGRLLR